MIKEMSNEEDSLYTAFAMGFCDGLNQIMKFNVFEKTKQKPEWSEKYEQGYKRGYTLAEEDKRYFAEIMKNILS